MPTKIDNDTIETTIALDVLDAGPEEPDFEEVTVHVVCTEHRYSPPDRGSWASDWDYHGTDEVELSVHLPGEDEPCHDLEARLTNDDWNRLESEWREAMAPKPTIKRPKVNHHV